MRSDGRVRKNGGNSTSSENTRLRIIPICRIKFKINEILTRAAKKRKAKEKKRLKQFKQPVQKTSGKTAHWNTNLLHGRVTRSCVRLMKNAFKLRLQYMCMPLLGDEHALQPHWEIHALSIIVEYAVGAYL